MLAAPADCTPLPAPSATEVAIVHGEPRVCVRGRAVVLGHGPAGAASAAGHRVAWIEQRRRHGIRTTTVTVARVGRRVHVLRRFTAERLRTRERAELDVLLTRRGDLAWAAGTSGGRKGVVAVKQPGKPTRRLAGYPASRLALEDGRTLRWEDDASALAFFDLRHAPCPSRSRYTELARDAKVILTRSTYGDNTVVRGCDPATGRDRVILQNFPEFGEQSTSLVGLDRTWAVFLQTEDAHDGSDVALTVVDAVTGRRSWAYLVNGDGVPYPPPTAAGGFTVTGRGVLEWWADGTRYALIGPDRIVVLEPSMVR